MCTWDEETTSRLKDGLRDFLDCLFVVLEPHLAMLFALYSGITPDST